MGKTSNPAQRLICDIRNCQECASALAHAPRPVVSFDTHAKIAVIGQAPGLAIVPMGFCYPGKGKTGDLPPRKECAPLWHSAIFDLLPKIELTLLIGKYAQDYYLENRKRTLTETVMHFEDYLPEYFVLPHPSPRNNIWMKKNAWFAKDVLPVLKQRVRSALRE